MELIFESVEERDRFFEDSNCCPDDCGGKCTHWYCAERDCVECWEQSGVKYRIKNQPTPEHPVPIEEQMSNKEEVKASVWNVWTMMKPGEKLVKTECGWRIEEKKEEPKKHWMDEKIENYVREVTRGDIQMFVMPGRQFGKSEIQRRMINALYGKDGIGFTTPTYSVLQKLDYEFYNNKNWKEALDIFMDKHDRIKKPQIEKVILNNPATIVFWKDGTKTVIKCQKGDMFDEEKGLAMAICKKVFGNDSGYYEEFKKWLPEESASKRLYSVGKLVSEAMNESMRRATESLKNLEKTLNGIKPSEPLKPCEECKHSDVHEFDEPCRSCSGNSGFEEKEEVLKVCANCKHNNNTHNWPCMHCGCISRDMFEPKDAK